MRTSSDQHLESDYAWFVGKPLSLLIDSLNLSGRIVEYSRRDDGGATSCVFKPLQGPVLTVHLDNWQLLKAPAESSEPIDKAYSTVKDELVRRVCYRNTKGDFICTPE